MATLANIPATGPRAAPKAKTPAASHKMGLVALTLLVISAMVGGGVFNLPQNMAASASLVSVLLAWIVSGLGIFFLARTFQVLADIKPEMTAGIYTYAREGFGKYAGFQIAWGYWLSAAFGNVGFAVLLMATLNWFFPPLFVGGNTWQAVVGGSLVFWAMNWMVLRGVKGAAALNILGTVAKFVPIAVFIGVLIIMSKAGMWTTAFWGNVAGNLAPASTDAHPLGNILQQVRGTMLVTLWVFIGFEGAVVMSDKSDQVTVGRATLLGFLITLALYVLVSILPFGIMARSDLASLASPSMAPLLSGLVGKWGEYLINGGVIVSVLSCWLVWTLLVAELPHAGAKDGSFPAVFARTNEHGAASVSLWVSSAIMQVMMILVYFSDNAWNVMLSITGVMILPAYLGSSGYLWKLMATGAYPEKARIGKTQALVSSILGTIYGVWLIYAAGLEFMLGGAFFFALGSLVYIWARREHSAGEALFKPVEMVVALALVVLGALAIWMLFTGRLAQVYSG